MRKIFKIIYYIFVTVIALVIVLFIVSSFPITGNYKIMIVQSGSMAPAIKTGSLVMVKPFNGYKQGDVITFQTDRKSKVPTTHRVVDVKIEQDQAIYVTKGDANNAPDIRGVLEKDIIGKVLIDVPWAGYLLATAKTPIGFAILVLIPAFLIVFDEVKKIFLEIKKIRNKG